jgi:hypothetical protein
VPANSPLQPTFDHYDPAYLGGQRTVRNGLLKHRDCNERRGAQLPTGCDITSWEYAELRDATRGARCAPHHGEGAMTEATFVPYAAKGQLPRLRAHLATERAGDVRWREKRQLSGSEFYVVGPSRLAREAHERAATWLTRSTAPT